MVSRWIETIDARSDAWAAGRSWVVRLPVLLCFAWILRGHLANPFYGSIVDGINLAIHELGHLVFAPFGTTLEIAGGSLLQCIAPIAAGWMLYRQDDGFGIAVATCWLSTNLFGVATYAGDARTQQLPLVSPTSGDPLHDWHYLLANFGILQHDRAIAAGLRDLAVFAMAAGLIFGGWLLWRMAAARPAPTTSVTAANAAR
jgi:hypothetical protein